MLAKFSEELKEARQRSEMTLQQIAARTKIDIKFLNAIEAGDFAFQPELYIRAFIKDYCKAIGIDEKRMLQRYDLAKQGKLDADIPPPPEPEKEVFLKPSVDAVPSQEPKPKLKIVDPYSQMPNGEQPKPAPPAVNKKIVLAGLIAVVLLVVGLVVYVLFFQSSSDAVIAEKSYDEILEENKKRYDDNVPKKQEPDVSTVSVDSLNLFIKAKDTTWIKIMCDSTLTEDFLLYPNSKKLLKAKKNFRLTVGNSGGVDFILNDKTLNFQGRKGKRSELIIDSSGIRPTDEQKAQRNL